MGLYTKEIDELLKEGIEIFDFDYDFYTDDYNIRAKFEKKFIQKYRYYEIGFDSVDKFKHYVNYKLDEIAPYYTQLYLSELRANDIDFMSNKHIEEVVTRELSKNKDINNIQLKNILSNIDINDITNATSTLESVNTNNKNLLETEKSEDVNRKNGNISTNAQVNSSGNNTNLQESRGSDTERTTGNTKNSSTGWDKSLKKESNVRDGLAFSSDDYYTNVNNDRLDKYNEDKNDTTTTTTTTLGSNVKNTNSNNSYSNSTQSNNISETDTLDSRKNRENKETQTNKGTNKSTDKLNKNSNSTSTVDDTLKADTKESELNKETTTTVNKGVIGVYSMADLLDKWRKVMINIDKQMLNEFKDLFMLIY